ncbi:MAG: acyl carrier protein [Asticcacaulis sp.]
MTYEEIYEKLKILIADFFAIDAGTLNKESSALHVDGWDSIGHVMLIIEIEAYFSVTLNGDDALQVGNIGELAGLIFKSGKP